eukprot:1569630-Rhodomonas_salina.1
MVLPNSTIRLRGSGCCAWWALSLTKSASDIILLLYTLIIIKLPRAGAPGAAAGAPWLTALTSLSDFKLKGSPPGIPPSQWPGKSSGVKGHRDGAGLCKSATVNRLGRAKLNSESEAVRRQRYDGTCNQVNV